MTKSHNLPFLIGPHESAKNMGFETPLYSRCDVILNTRLVTLDPYQNWPRVGASAG
jgi:hypothetical protein